ncbi:hypothetical protein EV384_5504 [Micromonospora kangleipakensis]|uniref:Uncharacterized protein n=1 Tax=Micromonospora kangleipakensis TaxID=1077942 RepID=A0A4Q8BFQ8_9ACTN|nr:hypothetical protein [Micromonospora kangleipakensis]RZU76812.1 hypothetical protein EV384_5504 [Micromonospora kangleipakensis]
MFFDGMPDAWEPVPLAQAAQRYDLGEASYDSVHLTDLFGDEPERFHVHAGDLTVDGPLALGNGPGEDEDTVYVVDGDLTVHGGLRRPGTRSPLLGDPDNPCRPAKVTAEAIAATIRPEFLDEHGHLAVRTLHRAVLAGGPVLR